jgi:hypothetical protein
LTKILFNLLAGSLLLLGVFMPAAAMGQKEKSVSFEQYTFELVPGMSQSLRGVDALVMCPNGSTVSGPLFKFDAARSGPVESGGWGMLAAPGAALGDGGEFGKVKVNAKNFKLEGPWEGIMGRNNAVTCFDAPLPANVVIKGTCGIEVVVDFRASNGMRGSFTGDVIC